MVETHKRILSKAKLALRPMTILASLARRQGSSINVPLRGTPLTPLRLAELEVCFEPHKKTVDNADDVIHEDLGHHRARIEVASVCGQAKLRIRLINAARLGRSFSLTALNFNPSPPPGFTCRTTASARIWPS